MSSRFWGVFQILLSGIGFGMLGIFGKQAYEKGLTPGQLLSLRFVVASATLGVGLLLIRPQLLRLSRSQLIASACLGILGYAIFSSFYFQALQGLSASLTVLLLYLYPVMVAVGARIFFKERMSPQAIVALPSVMLGLGLLLWGDISVSQPISFAFGVGSAVFYAIYILVSSRIIRDAHPISVAFYVQLFAAIVLAAVHLTRAPNLPQLFVNAAIPILGIAWISTVAPITLFLMGLRRLSNSETSILSTAEPFTAIIASALILGERLSSMQLVGGAIVIGALILLSLAPKKTEAAELRMEV